jgi:hypothetical protein
MTRDGYETCYNLCVLSSWSAPSGGFGNDIYDAITEGHNEIAVFTATRTPLPAALPLFATGLGALGLLGWRKKRKAQVAIRTNKAPGNAGFHTRVISRDA